MTPSTPSALTAVVVDIEGTIASIHFVKSVLFPYASAQYQPYIAGLDMSQQANIQLALGQSPFYQGEELGSDDAIAALLKDWTAKDFKDTTLKEIQGQIWQQGYVAGELKAPLYGDAEPFFKRCQARGLPLYSYSSGSVNAQKLFYRYNEAGDLQPYFAGYFDTTIGPKKEPASYTALAEAIGHEGTGLVFYSDHPEEVAAAAAAGWIAQLVCRPGEVSLEGHSEASSEAPSRAKAAIADFSGELV